MKTELVIQQTMWPIERPTLGLVLILRKRLSQKRRIYRKLQAGTTKPKSKYFLLKIQTSGALCQVTSTRRSNRN